MKHVNNYEGYLKESNSFDGILNEGSTLYISDPKFKDVETLKADILKNAGPALNDLLSRQGIKYNPLTAADNSVFYPVISSIGPNVLVANVAFWPRILSAREVRANGSPISNNSFFSKSAF